MKRINIKKTALSLLVLGCTLVPFANADSYVVNTETPVYYQSSEGSKLLGVLPEGTEVNDIMSGDNGYVLISLDNNYGYVKSDNLTFKDYNYPEVKTFNRRDILRAKESVNLRKGPSTDYEKIMTIQGDTEVECIGVAENGWYLIRVNENIGYSSPDYFDAFSDISMNYYGIDFGSMGYICNAYTTEKVNLRSGPSTDYQSLELLEKGEFLQLLQDHGDFYLVLTNDYRYGYVSKNYVYLLNNEKYLVTDFSSQTTTLYDGNDILIQDYCVTGKSSSPSALGVFEIIEKDEDRVLNGKNEDGSEYHSHVNYWMRYYKGQGLHDLVTCKSFGPSVKDSRRSHGCIRQTNRTAPRIYNNVSKGTKVINKK